MRRYHEKYRMKWVDAGYKADKGSACVVEPSPEGYLAAYNFLSLDDALDDIENAHLKVTRIAEANDPFEFEGLVGRENTSATGAIKGWKEDFNKDSGLLCFSKDWTSPALWAHYSRRHRGICLGFWIRTENLIHVVYDTERTKIGYSEFPPTLSDGTKKYLLALKANDWSYEDEVRRPVELSDTIELGANRFFRFDETLKLSEVILGSQCEEPLPKVKSIVRQHYRNVAVYKARSAMGFFKMVPDEETIPEEIERREPERSR